MFRYYGLLGLSLIIFSYVLRIIGVNPGFTETFVIGYWLFFDALDFNISGTSILHKIKKKHIVLFNMVLVGIIIGLIFEFFGVIVSNLWSYPNFDIFYINGIIFGYGFPILMYYSAYRVFYLIITRAGKFGTRLMPKKQERTFFDAVIYIGMVATIIPIFFIPFLGQLAPVSRGMLFALTLLGLWFILEGVAHRQHKRSLLKDILDGYWNPLAALVVAASITGISWEFFNTIDFVPFPSTIPI